MLKKMISLLLCLLLCAAALSVTAFAATEEEVGQVRKQITRDYYRALAASGMDSLQGYCGLQTSLQLYIMGINDRLITHDGKDQYDTYCNLDRTTGGYPVKAYSAGSYTLEEALRAVSRNGTRDVYNILVGFQRTSTAAGSIYGHAVVIYAILDGIMYFAEGFPTPMNGSAGGVIACSIDTFLDYYSDWTVFEGLVHFGRKTYVENCMEYPSHMFVEMKQNANLYTQPCNPEMGEVESQIVRAVAKGERLLVTAVYENTVGQYYYRVEEGDTAAYLFANRAEPLCFTADDIMVTDPIVPEVLTAGQDFEVGGQVSASGSRATVLHMNITDETGTIVLNHSLAKQNGQYDLAKDTFNLLLDFGTLEPGYYTYELRAECPSYYMQNGDLQARLDEWSILSSTFRVGNVPERTQAVAAVRAGACKDGWYYENGTWYCYNQGMPRSGWFCCNGVDYYLKSDGSVTTGWAEINGKARLFTDTGAMRTGWVQTEQGTAYLLSNGEAVKGWREIENQRYCFDQNGYLLHDCWLDEGENRYYLLSDGTPAAGWVELPEGRFCFRKDGCLLMQGNNG